jgi:integrase/recombinase XerC
MKDDFTDYLRYVRGVYAASTCEGISWKLWPFYRWLAKRKRHYAELSKEDIERYVLSLKCCREHKLNILNTLRQFYIYHGTDPNPTAEVIIKQLRKRKLYKVPVPAEITRKIHSIHSPDALVELRDRLMVELAYGSGLRRGEINRLDFEDINLPERIAFITGKGDRSRIVPLTKKSCDMLKAYLNKYNASTGPVFTNVFTGRRLSLHHISKIFHERTGLHTHLYRHACATHLLQNGCDIRVVQELLGHRKIDTTGIYTHLQTGDLSREITRTHPRSIK